MIFLTGEGEGQEVAVTAGELGMQVDLDATLAQAMSYSNAPNLIARYKAEKDLEHNGADLTPEITFDRNQVSAVVAQKCSAFNRKAVNASLRREAGNFVVEGGQTGLVVNVEESTDRILDYLNKNWGGQNARIALAMEVEEPKGSAEAFIYAGRQLAPTSIKRKRSTKKQGVYFEEAYAIGGYDDSGKAYITMDYGPRYASGYEYDIIDDGEDLWLANEQLLWVS